MANLTKDEVNVLAQRALDVRKQEVNAYNENVKMDPEYQAALVLDNNPLYKELVEYERLDNERKMMLTKFDSLLNRQREKLLALDPNNSYVNRYSISVKDFENRLTWEVQKKYFKSLGNEVNFANKLKSVAVMNKTKSPTEVLEILLGVQEDEN